MCFSYSIEQFTTLKNFYSFLINAERTETKQFVSTINALKLWKNKQKRSRIWFEIKISTRLDLAIIIINWLCLKKSWRARKMSSKRFDKSTKSCNKKLMSWRQLTKQLHFNVEDVHLVRVRQQKICVTIFQSRTLRCQQENRRNISILNLSSVVEKISNEKNDVKRLRLRWSWTLIIETTKRLKLITSAFASVKKSLIMYMLNLTIFRTIFTRSDKMWSRI